MSTPVPPSPSAASAHSARPLGSSRVPSGRGPLWSILNAPRFFLIDVLSALGRALRLNREGALDAIVICLFFFGFAGQGFRYLLGFYGSAAPMALLFVAFWASFFSTDRVIAIRRISTSVSLFVFLCAISLSWSAYPFSTAVSAIVSIGVSLVGTGIAIALPMDRLLHCLIRSFQWILGASYALEAYVALIRGAKLPPWTMRDQAEIPAMSYWVEGNLLRGGPIQGFMGNRNPLAFVALLLLICVALRWLDNRDRSWSALVWIGACAATLLLTQSATVTMAGVGCAVVMAAFMAVKAAPADLRHRIARGLLAGGLVVAASSFLLRRPITEIFDRSPDMSGRGDIWRALLPLWQERPILGWGWTIGWPAELEMFAHLVPRSDGTPTTQAHNATIEAGFQLGVVGAFFFLMCVAWVYFGVFRVAISHLDDNFMDLAPFIILTALIIQSLTESRFLFEGNWMLFVALATWLKVRGNAPATRGRWRADAPSPDPMPVP
ncbi:O-antigen ligase family protein [Actinomyces sp. B33]|uniref:O-antigen ligase family protein n=1 Tax=Actinomyces sp. B33 TaxID=2942131 RepID=UPI00233F987B|nr:O-antigen ligase family protein [Actinomyces sp. B33]MDC4233005.1 O-antigen ligase family protein [Actinomyces sp. B33]